MKIELAHLRERATSGGWIDFAVFTAKSTTGDNGALLVQLTQAARASGLKVDQSALAFSAGGQVRFFGDKNLVSYLSRNGVPSWTHTIDV
ncbi:hypothetical protein [Trinickia diaoshuihuensis]|uniref:hypothetical protein n=1 Tax=Trinickia diaoshuihuensis TaxID=2292265 RepID=UPI000E246217|nr:hypothetical protein [Trinickia diaoshuihuensis]